MRRNIIILNIIFVILFLFFLLLSIFYGTFIGCFFIPILCCLPFAFRKKGHNGLLFDESQLKAYKVRYCPVCKGEIKESIAKFCLLCGAKLNNEEMR